MRRDQSEASSSRYFSTPNTSLARGAVDNHKEPLLRHAQSKPNTSSGQPSGIMKMTDDATCGAQELDQIQSRRANNNETPSTLGGVRPVTPPVLQQQFGPLVRSPTEIKDTTENGVDPIDSLSLDATAGAAEVAKTVAHTWPIDESIGSHLNPQTASFAPSSYPGDASEDEWPMFDAENGNSNCTDRSRANNPFGSARTSSVKHGHGERPYTSQFDGPSLLNVPLKTGSASSRAQSDITDAGDQAELQHRLAQPQSPESSFSSTYSLADWDFSSPYELQESILDAYQQTRDDQSFLPKRDLVRLITPESVFRELSNVLGGTLSPVQIKSLAVDVCAETTIELNGKPKIKSFRKIFALLVIAEASSAIRRFLNENVSDLDLPLTPIKASSIKGFRRKNSTNPLKCFERWSPTKLHHFHNNQWKMLAAFFSHDSGGDVKHYRFQDQHILPFVTSHDTGDSDTEIRGGYGRVFMVHIHRDHHNFPGVASHVCKQGFAVKQQLYDGDRESFEKEAKILKMFSGPQSHKHIVSLLTTYEHLGKYHLIFHRAESNLLTFWNDLERQPDFEYGNILWMAEQCAGIAEGLYRLHKRLTFTVQPGSTPAAPELAQDDISLQEHSSRHVRFDSGANHVHVVPQEDEMEGAPLSPIERFCPVHGPQEDHASSSSCSKGCGHNEPKVYGRHGDIHPGNMLWFAANRNEDRHLRGTLKIADFGQAELNCIMSKTKPRSVAHTVTYRPPECDIENALIRQEYDIWCLGCVYLEFVTWMLGGARLLRIFIERRLSLDHFQRQSTDTFFRTTVDPATHKPEFKVKEKVVEFIEELHAHPNCTEFFHGLLNTIKYDMLVVDSRERTPCGEISRRLKIMHSKCRRDITYAATKCPWELRCIGGRSASTPLPRENREPGSPTRFAPRAWSQGRGIQSLATM